MANCVNCGSELPALSAGNLCLNCRTAVGANPAFASPASVPAAGANIRRRNMPITTVLVGINVAVFALMILTGVSPTAPTAEQLLKWGADWGPLSLGMQPWRMLTSNYLHIGIVHILLNMWCLWNLGTLAERVFEGWTYVLIYTMCGIAGSLGSLWWHPLIIGAGASGAIFGVAGALIAALYLGKLPVPKQAMQSTLKSLLAFAGYNLFFGAVGAGIDNSAHIGGLVAGLAMGAALAKHLTSEPEVRNSVRRYVFLGMALVLLAGTMYVKAKNGYVVQHRSSVAALGHGG